MNPKPRTWCNLEEKRLMDFFMMSVSSIMRRTKWYKITDHKTGREKNRVQIIRPAVKAHQRRWAPEEKRTGLGPSPEISYCQVHVQSMYTNDLVLILICHPKFIWIPWRRLSFSTLIFFTCWAKIEESERKLVNAQNESRLYHLYWSLIYFENSTPYSKTRWDVLTRSRRMRYEYEERCQSWNDSGPRSNTSGAWRAQESRCWFVHH